MRSERVPTFTEQARRRQIVDAALEVIAESGYAQASLARIAEHIGVAKSVVLYHFTKKSEVVDAVFAEIFNRGAAVIVPAVRAENTSAAKLSAYIRANVAFVAANRSAAVAMLELMAGYRDADGLRLDQAAAKAVQEHPPTGDLAALDPLAIFDQGVRSGEFRDVPPLLMKNILRGALDSAAQEYARDAEYDVIGHGEALVEVFEMATARQGVAHGE
ncbi:TetR family transcriptional regulator [Mycolicibacterium mageritense DSM 44476 = CIP 104973]|uniref:Transcriptional regulator, TetR family protein n=1 Tax=Mycolicibacterium mageritense TaxID=53462 RepID=A0ABN5YCF2_MYCME|nr:TetR/AcrR family transcriptional regulator [Mycolicibacterium mageritense]MCC9183370.1 TetR/AcrR family transcriptional regulator [Mycolicibacterium mageritense]BBX35310.1 putative transcriptional regulator, TetR family protein [Mycolicibacterium mageritense]GJJ18623.1 putative transcriptional regulator, TetR family protein [Mycolicibacterium mageritense]CDO20180.1 TetR family transcriptional regulator [Mycolicibacterium mageritense DSM 44476 = CIP 104973]